jgi:hypothetical protein
LAALPLVAFGLILWMRAHVDHASSISQVTTTPVTLAVPSFSLKPGLLRSGGGTQIKLPKRITAVQFDLGADELGRAGTYRVFLETPERPQIWNGASSWKDGHLLVTLPAAALAPGDYTLSLRSADGSDHSSPFAVCYFRIVKQN